MCRFKPLFLCASAPSAGGKLAGLIVFLKKLFSYLFIHPPPPPQNNFFIFFFYNNSSFVLCNLWAAVPTQQFENTNNINKYILLQFVPLHLSYCVTHKCFQMIEHSCSVETRYRHSETEFSQS